MGAFRLFVTYPTKTHDLLDLIVDFVVLPEHGVVYISNTVIFLIRILFVDIPNLYLNIISMKRP